MRNTRRSFFARVLLTATWLWLCSGALAAGGNGIDETKSFGACTLALQTTHFSDVGPNATKLEEKCQSRLRHLSLYLCLKVYGRSGGWADELAAQNDTCERFLHTPLPPFDIVANYTDTEVPRLRQVTLQDWNDRVTFDEEVIVSDALHGIAYGTLYAWDYAYSRHFSYGWAMAVFWIVVVLAGASARLVSAIRRHRGSSEKSQSRMRTVIDRVPAWVCRHITAPATFGYRCAQNLGWCTIPPRGQSLTILVFLILNIFVSTNGYIVMPVNLYFNTPTKQLLRYVSDRTGIVSFANFPMIWLFGMRNNLALWLTGWDFGTYNNFHRWVARIATLQAVVHSIGYTVLILLDGGWEYFAWWWTQLFFWTGEVATILMCLLLGLAVYWLRRKQYETFLIIHVVLSIFILLTMLGHVSIFKVRYDLMVWIPATIWAADRILRVSRTLSFNRRFWNTKASVKYDPSSNIIRLAVPSSSSLYTPQPGTFYYLHVLSDKRFWESHPFTMAYSTGAREACGKDLGENAPLLPAQHGRGGDEAFAVGSEGGEGEPSMVGFLIRPYDGFTSRLRDAASRSSRCPQSGPVSIQVLVEGPYGRTGPFVEYENVLFVVGGSGIVVAMAYLRSLVSNAGVRSVGIVWAVREPAFAEDILLRDLGPLVGGKKVSLKICMTLGSGCAGFTVPELPEGVRLQYGRPDVRLEVEDAAGDMPPSERLAVVACGPARMADDARRAVVESMGSNGPRVEYFEESFRW
ncbi:ferric-chelate reductase [Sodiomyces alkalinus F11]|uniref:Ferric-chelate reductase n=1 Tax=Sodiomyces alkalinus (strain CBS 110278 / VKM F-3762 / F11) TaxID=1314773 RepID=A0A3N2PKV5_SODAK|nr:ferric-chelate reductase [Sodiomyces alkalinus F11]ROT35044.1 ferric-chelate reductase [Sodiomyces alkalinus F11]